MAHEGNINWTRFIIANLSTINRSSRREKGRGLIVVKYQYRYQHIKSYNYLIKEYMNEKNFYRDKDRIFIWIFGPLTSGNYGSPVNSVADIRGLLNEIFLVKDS